MTDSKSWLDSWPVYDEEESFFEEDDDDCNPYSEYDELPEYNNFVCRATPWGEFYER